MAKSVRVRARVEWVILQCVRVAHVCTHARACVKGGPAHWALKLETDPDMMTLPNRVRNMDALAEDEGDLSPFTFHSETAKKGFLAEDQRVKGEKVKVVKQPVEWGEKSESLMGEGESFTQVSEPFTFSQMDETAILIAVIDLQAMNVKVTREAIKQKAGME